MLFLKKDNDVKASVSFRGLLHKDILKHHSFGFASSPKDSVKAEYCQLTKTNNVDSGLWQMRTGSNTVVEAWASGVLAHILLPIL